MKKVSEEIVFLHSETSSLKFLILQNIKKETLLHLCVNILQDVEAYLKLLETIAIPRKDYIS